MDCFTEVKYREKGRDMLNNKKHSHDNCYEIIQTWSNDGQIIIKDRIYPITSGAIYFINAADTHCTIPKETEIYSRSKLILSADYLNNVAKLTGGCELIAELFTKNGGRYFPLNTKLSELSDELFKNIFECYKSKSDNKKAIITAYILILLSTVYQNGCEEYIEGDNKLTEVFDYVNANITQNLTIDMISKTVHINKYYLCHLFKTSTNMTIMEYVLDRRLSIAKKKLLSTDSTISDIAMTSGFSSFSYFCRIFHKIVGSTPKEFRKENSKRYLS